MRTDGGVDVGGCRACARGEGGRKVTNHSDIILLLYSLNNIHGAPGRIGEYSLMRARANAACTINLLHRPTDRPTDDDYNIIIIQRR